MANKFQTFALNKQTSGGTTTVMTDTEWSESDERIVGCVPGTVIHSKLNNTALRQATAFSKCFVDALLDIAGDTTSEVSPTADESALTNVLRTITNNITKAYADNRYTAATTYINNKIDELRLELKGTGSTTETINSLATKVSTNTSNISANTNEIASVKATANSSVNFNSAQSLTSNQKLTARNNIGASNFSGDYDDLTNKPTLFSGDYADLTNKGHLYQYEIRLSETVGNNIISLLFRTISDSQINYLSDLYALLERISSGSTYSASGFVNVYDSVNEQYVAHPIISFEPRTDEDSQIDGIIVRYWDFNFGESRLLTILMTNPYLTTAHASFVPTTSNN